MPSFALAVVYQGRVLVPGFGVCPASCSFSLPPPTFGNETNVTLERETETLSPMREHGLTQLWQHVCKGTAVLRTGSRDGSGHSTAQGNWKKVMVWPEWLVSLFINLLMG